MNHCPERVNPLNDGDASPMKLLRPRCTFLLLFSFVGFSNSNAQVRPKSMMGTWIAWHDSSKTKCEMISLYPDGSGVYGPGTGKDGHARITTSTMLSLKNWAMVGDTLIMTTHPVRVDQKGTRESVQVRFVLLTYDRSSFKATYSDPEREKATARSGEVNVPYELQFVKLK